MKKKLLALSMTAVLSLSIFAGCSGGSGGAADGASADSTTPASESGSGAAASGDVVSIIASQDWVKDVELELADKFTDETGIKVDYQIVPSGQYDNLLMTKLNSGECADIFMHQSGTFDIDSMLQVKDNAVDLSGEEWVGRFQQAVKDQVSVDGVVYGVTFWDQGDSYAYIYNKRIFAELGLEIPGNYEEFKAVCQTLLDNGITPIYECVADGWHHVLPFTEVSGAYDAAVPNMVELLNTNATTFSEQEIFATVLRQYKEIVDLGYWGEYYMSNEYDSTGMAMASGEYAMTVNMMGRVDLILDENPELSIDDFGYFPYRYGDNQVIATTPCGPSKFIYSGSSNIEGAKQYIDFLARPENLQYMIDNEGSFNSMPFDGLTTTYSAQITEAKDQYMDTSKAVYQNIVKYLNPQWMDIGKDLAGYLMGEMDEAQVLQSIDKRRDDQATTASDENW